MRMVMVVGEVVGGGGYDQGDTALWRGLREVTLDAADGANCNCARYAEGAPIFEANGRRLGRNRFSRAEAIRRVWVSLTM